MSNVRSVEPISRGRQTSNTIVEAARDLFWEQGYHATSMREIAERAGVQPASLYHHFRSKEDLLEELMSGFMQELQREVVSAIGRAATPRERLAAAVRTHVRRHGLDQRAAIVADTELRALTGSRRERVVALRDSYEAIFRQLLADGVEAGTFHVRDLDVAARAILLQSTGVAVWYRESGRLPLAEVAEAHVELALGAVGSPPVRPLPGMAA
ncbi:MAG: TetR/AcrR family transcriptional regulator [Gaiellales bacterium]